MEKSDRTTSNVPGLNYGDYLKLDQLLDCQHPQSEAIGHPCHDEMLFISVHQVHELWFKQVLHEMQAVLGIFEGDDVDDRRLGFAVAKLQRVIKIVSHLRESAHILETMSPLDFLEFRDFLAPASGFQSLQFRVFEAKFGLRQNDRIPYAGGKSTDMLRPQDRLALEAAQKGKSLFDVVQSWLERTPFLETDDYSFWQTYRQAMTKRLEGDQRMLAGAEFQNPDHLERQRSHAHSDPALRAIFDDAYHGQLMAEGKIRLSLRATQAALFINLYRDEPLFHLPYQFLTLLVDLDETVHSWRLQHIQLVTRMIGNRIGTGGSSGMGYLQQTANHHRVFFELVTLPSFMVPRSDLPDLPQAIREKLSFHFRR